MMKTNPGVIVFDLDDVIFDLRSQVEKALHAASGQYLPWQDWHTYALHDLYDLSHNEILDAFGRHRILECALPEPDACAAVEAVRSVGYQVAAVTARGWHPEGRRITEESLVRHGLDVDELHVVALADSKRHVIEQIGQVQLIIDDSPTHLLHLDGGPWKVVAQDRPWNRHLTHLPRVSTLAQFADMVRDHGRGHGQRR